MPGVKSCIVPNVEPPRLASLPSQEIKILLVKLKSQTEKVAQPTGLLEKV